MPSGPSSKPPRRKPAAIEQKPTLRSLPAYWNSYFGGLWRPEYEVETGLPARRVVRAHRAADHASPTGFHIHPKVKKLLEQRAEMGTGKRAVDYGMAEALAFACLVKTGTPVRLSGQDTRRGTFNQRHSVLIDIENDNENAAGEHRARPGALRNLQLTLSEAGVLGFEYGYSRDYPEAWCSGRRSSAISSTSPRSSSTSSSPPARTSGACSRGLVMLLPHGYEGQGPEHSSARIERYLQLAAKHNIQVAQPSNAAQYFHCCAARPCVDWRKPLVVLTPKSMLRHPTRLPIEDFTHKNFLNVSARHRSRRSRAHPHLHRKNRSRTSSRTKKRKDTSTAIFPGTALSVPRGRSGS